MKRSDLGQMKQHILRVEAGGAPNMALRRQFNAMLRSRRHGTHKHKLRGGAVEDVDGEIQRPPEGKQEHNILENMWNLIKSQLFFV